MANILDIRRRIRSVTNTRQITKAMKMVSAAKLRRAQDRALAARPYAQMLTNVLKSLVSRAEIYEPDTGQPKHPLLAQRPEQNVLLIVGSQNAGTMMPTIQRRSKDSRWLSRSLHAWWVLVALF